MSENALSAQGTQVEIQRDGVGDFTILGELRDTSGPSLTRNQIETTSHDSADEHIVVGIRRKGDMSITIGYRPGLESHRLLFQSWEDGSRDIFRLTFPDGPDTDVPIEGGTTWLFSGYVTTLGPEMPVDDGLTADLTIKPTNKMTVTFAEEA